MVSFQPAKINVEGKRYLSLTPMDGKKSLNSHGNTDPRLFTGENKLIAHRDATSLWSLKYEMGVTPVELRQSYTKFSTAMANAQEYFKRRNIEVKEIVEDV